MFLAVSAAAVIGGAANAKIVVSGNRGNTAPPDFGDDFIGPDVVTYQIAEAVHGIGFAGIDVGEH